MVREARDIVVVGSGNAALCAALAVQERGREVLVVEKATPDLASGNTAYTAGAMRFAYDGGQDLVPLLADPGDPRLPRTDAGTLHGRKRSLRKSDPTLRWLATMGIKFEPIYSRQSLETDGRFVFWGGLAAKDEGYGLAETERGPALWLSFAAAISLGAVVMSRRGAGASAAVASTAEWGRSPST